jgi:ParB family transcriptional regulator, chromosome partitioning protein
VKDVSVQPEKKPFDSAPEHINPEMDKSAERAPTRLGRGLAALIGDVDTELQAVERARSQRRIAIELIDANPRNPRKSFAEEDLSDLASSIREKGIVQPILVRPVDGTQDRYEIVAGERRWRAAQRAGLHEVPVIIHRITEAEALQLAIIENVQRADLNPLEEAAGYQQLIDQFGYKQEDVAGIIGKSRSHVANTLRLLKLPEMVQGYLREGRLTAGHARTLVSKDDPETLARAMVEQGLTVRDAETLARSGEKTRNRRVAPGKDADTRELEKRLADSLGLAVDIRHQEGGKGELRIRYRVVEQLDEVVRRLLAG